MIDRLLDLFRKEDQDKDEIDPALAASALMFEVVWADHDIDDQELHAMSSLLESQFSLSPQRVTEIINQTRANHDASVGVFPFTRALNEQLSQQEKFAVIRSMWAIALADQQIDVFEEHTIRRIADLLYVPHAKFIEAKLAEKAARES